MARMNMIQAIRDALDVKLTDDDDVVVFGEDVGYFGGVFRATQGLQEKYGKSRVFDDPVIFLEPKRLYNGPFNGHHERPGTPWSEHEMGLFPRP